MCRVSQHRAVIVWAEYEGCLSLLSLPFYTVHRGHRRDLSIPQSVISTGDLPVRVNGSRHLIAVLGPSQDCPWGVGAPLLGEVSRCEVGDLSPGADTHSDTHSGISPNHGQMVK